MMSMKLATHVMVGMALISTLALAQDTASGIEFVRGSQRVIVENLRLRPAGSQGEAPEIATAVQTVISDTKVCCGDDSVLGETPAGGAARSLREIGDKLDGRHVLPDGKTVTIAARYFPAIAISSDLIVVPLLKQQPLLMKWNSRVYVLYGAIYDDQVFYDGHHDYVIQKLLLLDPRSPGNPQAIFDRQKDDWSKVEGLLALKVTEQ